MERLLVELIGFIISRLKAARDVVVAPTTCREWHKAFQSCLFDTADWPENHHLTSSCFKYLITRTIFQTNGLQCQSIFHMNDPNEFTGPIVTAWLIYTRKTLRQLYFDARTKQDFNILEECRRGRLEVLSLIHNTVTNVDLLSYKFPFLNSLSLVFVPISTLDLNHLLSPCPKLESFAFGNLDFFMSDDPQTISLNNSRLKYIYVRSTNLDKFILQADTLEKLHFDFCTINVFELVSKGTPKHLIINYVNAIPFHISSGTENLEAVDFRSYKIMWSTFCHMISRSSKLRRLALWGVEFEDGILDLKTISSCCPLLSHLSLWYHINNGKVVYRFNGSFRFENVVNLEIGWTRESKKTC